MDPEATTYTVGLKLKHVAYSGNIVELLEQLPDKRWLVQGSTRKSKISEETLRKEYSRDLEAPIRPKSNRVRFSRGW